MGIKHAVIQNSGTITASAITASFADVLAMDDDCDVLVILNSLDTSTVVTLPNETGSPGEITLPGGSGMTLDFRTNGQRLAKGTIQAKSLSTLPSFGLLSITAIR